jgi:hypothetical protein
MYHGDFCASIRLSNQAIEPYIAAAVLATTGNLVSMLGMI